MKWNLVGQTLSERSVLIQDERAAHQELASSQQRRVVRDVEPEPVQLERGDVRVPGRPWRMQDDELRRLHDAHPV